VLAINQVRRSLSIFGVSLIDGLSLNQKKGGLYGGKVHNYAILKQKALTPLNGV
jgi:hypothetical protein